MSAFRNQVAASPSSEAEKPTPVSSNVAFLASEAEMGQGMTTRLLPPAIDTISLPAIISLVVVPETLHDTSNKMNAVDDPSLSRLDWNEMPSIVGLKNIGPAKRLDIATTWLLEVSSLFAGGVDRNCR